MLVEIKVNQMAWAQYILDHKGAPNARTWEQLEPWQQDAYRERVKNICYTLAQYPPETTVKILTEARTWAPK